MTDLSEKDKALIKLGKNRRLAHKTIFQHRHPQKSPDFHYEIMDLWASPTQHAMVMAFRGAAKSTLAEEAITLSACYQEFNNAIVLGETYHRAVERLAVIKREIETNELIGYLFGDLVGSTWTENKLVLANGRIIQAFGRGQSLRGSKHLDWRPDLAFGDDVEDDESCASEDLIDKTKRWLLNVVMPALAPGYRMRINGTPLHPKSVLMQLYGDPEWEHRKYPIERLNPETGEREATWSDRFPLDAVDVLRARAERMGNMTGFRQEYMCEAEDQASKPFNQEMLHVEPIVRTWQAVYAMYDPARTTNKTSATTGKAVWSWSGNRLVVWDAGAEFWKPDEILEDIFRTDTDFNPVEIYVEEDGLNEWLLQPIRHEQTKRQYILPIRPVRAPKGKLDFIRQMQPFFKAKEIVFAKPLEDLRSQLLSFPTGRIDAPNALAYALRLRPGSPVYEGFGTGNILESLDPLPRSSLYLALNATQQHTTGVLIQLVEGTLHVLADWVREGDPGGVLSGLMADAGLAAGRAFAVLAGPQHFTQYDAVGLLPAAARVPCTVRSGGLPLDGRAQVRALLTKTVRSRPAVQVSAAARWTLNAFSGGYCYEVTKHGTLSDFTKSGPYRTLMEGLETAAALLSMGQETDADRSYAQTPGGRMYLTALATGKPEMRPSKADFVNILSTLP